MKKIFLVLNFLYFVINFQNQLIKINKLSSYIIVNHWNISYISNFQIGFYLKIINKYDNINIFSLTDYKNFNINIIIKSVDNKIFINNMNTNIILNDLSFVYLKGEIINNIPKITIKINNIVNSFIYNYKKIINFSVIDIILGSNKNLTNFKFDGRILYLNSFINDTTSRFEDLKNIPSNILIYHNFSNSYLNADYFYNEVNNGFIGSFNGSYDNGVFKNKLEINEVLNTDNRIQINAYFKNSNSYISLSTDFIKYLSIFDRIIYSVYLSLKFNRIFNSYFSNLNYEFYFYKRNNLKFMNKITNLINTYFNFQIHSTNNILKSSGSSYGHTYFKFIWVRVFNISENNYNINYIYKTNKSSINEYNNLDETINENHIFSNNDKHYIGVLNFSNPTNAFFIITIYETSLILGTNFNIINSKIYSKISDQDFVLFCDNNSIFIKNRKNSLSNCENDSKDGKKYLIDFCIYYKDSICYKCMKNKKLYNNTCINKDKIYKKVYLENYKLFSNSSSTNNIQIHDFQLIGSPEIKNYTFNCNFKIFNESYIDITFNINGVTLAYISKRYTSPVNNYEININLNLKNTNDIKIIKIDYLYYINYDCKIYTSKFIEKSKNISQIENCNYLMNDNKFIWKITNFSWFECIDKFKIPNGYYLDEDLNIIFKCNDNCKVCQSSYFCTECKENYYLNSNKCVKYNNNLCEVYNNYNDCVKCKPNIKNNLIKKDVNFCFECYTGCKTCESPLFNECLSCNIGYLYYNELKQCISNSLNICNHNYVKINPNNCISDCKTKDSNNNCLSCHPLLNLDKSINKCVNCSSIDRYFKNNLIFDSENRATCEKCSELFNTCFEDKYKCTSCLNNKYLLINIYKCVDAYPKGMYRNNNLCLDCTKNCLDCDIDNINCIECNSGLFIKGNICVNNCGDNYFNIENKCINCINNCKKCLNDTKCLDCNKNFYLNLNNTICTTCISNNYLILNNKCIKCSNNCNSCNISKNNCSSCKKGMKLVKNGYINSCITICPINQYFDVYKNICNNCDKCDYCYKNNMVNCKNCEKCKINCNWNFIYKDFSLFITINNSYDIDFNIKYQLENIKSNNKINNNTFILNFNKKIENNFINKSINNSIIINSKNCLPKPSYLIITTNIKPSCIFKLDNIIDNNDTLIVNFKKNFFFVNIFEINIFITESGRLIKYKVLLVNKYNLKLQLFPNYFKSNFNISIRINKKYINMNSCYPLDIEFQFDINFFTKIFDTDFDIKNKQISNLKDLNIINNIKIISKTIKSVTSNTSLIILITNIFNSGNLLWFLSIIQLVNILEVILLIPIDIGNIVNSFIKYFKLDLDIDFNLDRITNFDNNTIYFITEKVYISNTKTYNANWVNIVNLKIDIFIIFVFYILIFILNIIKYILPIKYNYVLKIINKLIIFFKIIKFSLVESLKIIIIISILVIYFNGFYYIKWNLNNFKILILIIIYFLIMTSYVEDLINSLLNIKYINYFKDKNLKKYYKSILFLNSKIIDRYSIYQFIYILKDFLFVMVIFVLKSIKMHAFLLFLIQLIFILYTFSLKAQNNYFKIQKLRIEEIINLLLITSIILNYYFNLEQFQLFFIILYILLFFINFLILIYSILKFFLLFILNSLDKNFLK